MMSHPQYVDVQALLMEPVEIRTMREWKRLHVAAVRSGVGLGFVFGLLAGLVVFPVALTVAAL